MATRQVLSYDRANIAQLCSDPWVLTDGPMPPETDAVAIELGGADKLCAGQAQASSGWARRVGMYLVYGAFVGGALLFHKRGRAAPDPSERF